MEIEKKTRKRTIYESDKVRAQKIIQCRDELKHLIDEYSLRLKTISDITNIAWMTLHRFVTDDSNPAFIHAKTFFALKKFVDIIKKTGNIPTRDDFE